jgi:hypothetical protein
MARKKRRHAPQPIPEMTEKDVKRFWSKVDVCSHNECWSWKSIATASGYGRIRIRQKLYSSHRVAFHLANPTVDITGKKNVIMHSCDNRLCCNPEHLMLGTLRENFLDMVRKGRGGIVANLKKKEDTPHARLRLRSLSKLFFAYVKKIRNGKVRED